MIKQIIENNAEIKPNSKKLEALREYFAGCFTAEGTFDIERFKDIMKDEVDIINEGYSLDFLGKDYANLIASIDTTTVIEPDLEHNAKPENKDSENIYISGDNLDALKHLLKSYAGKVKCIYIDPPYNTGSDGFVYNDKFRFTPEELEKKLNIDEDEARRILDLTSRGSSTHSAWLMFMSPRLQLARELLSKDGVIFISIDENEQANLKLLCDYVFGEDNFIGIVVWNNATDNNPTNLAIEHEYILCYARDKESIESVWKSNVSEIKDLLIKKGEDLNKQFKGEELQKEWKKWYRENKSQLGPFDDYKFIDEGGVYTGSRSVHNPGKEGYRYDIIHPITKKPCTQPLMGYRFPETSMQKLIDEGRILFGDDESKLVEIKLYASEYQDKFSSVYEYDSRAGANELKKLFPEAKQIFKNPKPIDVVEHILSYIDTKDLYIMDFFGGSSTTAHAIMQLNQRQNIRLKYILVQIQEKIAEEKEAYKLGYRTIDEIGQERIKRAAEKIKTENPLFAGDLGFKHYTLKDVPENVLDRITEFSPIESGFANNLLQMFGRETVLETWKVRDGYGMNAEVEEVKLADYTAYQCGDHLYLTDEGMSDDAITALVDKYGEQTDWGPHYVVLFGYNFNFVATDALKKNLPLLSVGEKQIKINIDIRY